MFGKKNVTASALTPRQQQKIQQQLYGKNALRARPIEEMGRCQGCGKKVNKKANTCSARCAKAAAERYDH